MIESGKPKVLIATAWWPSKTRFFAQYAAGIVSQLEGVDYESELFIATSYASHKFESITKSMFQAQQWAEGHGCSHILNVEADKVLPPGLLSRLLSHKKPVVYAGDDIDGGGSGLTQLDVYGGDGVKGWGVVLATVDALRQVPFDTYAGQWLWPDRMWLKKLNYLGVSVWMDRDCKIKTLEAPSQYAGPTFAPKQEVTHG